MFTKYGRSIADPPETIAAWVGSRTGADAHRRACELDAGILIKITGHDYQGKRFHRHARSVSGAFFLMQAISGLENAWHITDQGRKLVIRR